MKQAIFLVWTALYLIMAGQTNAQVAVPFKSTGSDSVSVVYIWHADTLRQISKDSNQIQSLFGNVKLQQGKTFFYCDSVAMNQSSNIVEAFGKVHINDNDSTDIYSQYMKYFVDKKLIIFQKTVSLTDGKGKLSTEELQYDMKDKVGTYFNGGKVVSGTSVVTSRDGVYYADTKDVHFKKDVVLKDPAYDLTADSLLYNTQTRIATFITQTHIRDSSGRTIQTKDGYYDLAHHRAQFNQRATIQDSAQTITADNIQFDDSVGISTAIGSAVFIDTVQGTTVLAGVMIADKKKNTLLATQHPVMIIKEDKDSLYVTADTLFSGRLDDSLLHKENQKDSLPEVLTSGGRPPSSDSGSRYLQGYHHVRIFSDSLQAVSDSLFYNGKDSVFQLYKNPIVWATGHQITGDTVYLYTKNKKPERLYVFENGFVVNLTGNNMYNQIKSNTLNGYFKDGVIEHMRARGSAEAIYYIKDDSLALVGVNRVNAANIIDMIFVDNELNKVILRNDVDGTMFPIRKVKPEEMILRKFKWFEDKRPKTRSDILERPSPEGPPTPLVSGPRPEN